MKVRVTLLGELGEAEALAIVKGYESEVEEHGQITLEGPLDIDTVDDAGVSPHELSRLPSASLRMLIREYGTELLRRTPPAEPTLQPVPASHAWDRRPVTKPVPIASNIATAQPTPASHSWNGRRPADATGPIPEPEHALPTADELAGVEHDDGPAAFTT
jgi:hypothetical protein